MANYNKVLLMGNLTRDVELKYTTSNQAVANIGLAVNRRYRKQDGEMQDETTFVDCEAWGRTAENMAKFFSKGRPVFIEGRLKLDQWQDKEGGNRSKLRVVVENFEFVDSRGGGGQSDEGGGGGGRYAPANASSGAGTGSSGGEHEPISESDIPF